MASDVIEQNRQIGQRFVDFLTRGGDPSTLFNPDFTYYDAQGQSHDIAGAMQLMQPILVAIPDRAIQVEEEIITETRVVLRWRRSGTFQNDAWGCTPPTTVSPTWGNDPRDRRQQSRLANLGVRGLPQFLHPDWRYPRIRGEPAAGRRAGRCSGLGKALH